MSAEARIFALADRFDAALRASDLESAIACFSADVRVWHNPDEIEHDRAAMRVLLSQLFALATPIDVTVTKRLLTSQGYVQLQRFTGHKQAGGEVNWAACLVVTVHDDLISRIDEYLDSAPLAEFMA